MSRAASVRTTHLRAESPNEKLHWWERLRRNAAYFWVGYLMLTGLEKWPGLVLRARPFFLWFTWHGARVMRRNLMLNARRLLGEGTSDRQLRAHCKLVLSNFYQFIYELGRTPRMSDAQLDAQIAGVEGRERYDKARQRGRGAILVTAHLGSFEIGMASLRQIEQHVHVVFRRDPMPRFERLRRLQHERLGVTEATVSDGLHVWMGLRDALEQDHVVLLQGDRVMPDQAGERLPFCGGHMMFPPGPIKLALATGAPIVPIFSIREADGRVRIYLEEPIDPEPIALRKGEPHPALVQMAGTIERYVKRFPDQWLRVQRAFYEDIETEGHQ